CTFCTQSPILNNETISLIADNKEDTSKSFYNLDTVSHQGGRHLQQPNHYTFAGNALYTRILGPLRDASMRATRGREADIGCEDRIGTNDQASSTSGRK